MYIYIYIYLHICVYIFISSRQPVDAQTKHRFAARTEPPEPTTNTDQADQVDRTGTETNPPASLSLSHIRTHTHKLSLAPSLSRVLSFSLFASVLASSTSSAATARCAARARSPRRRARGARGSRSPPALLPETHHDRRLLFPQRSRQRRPLSSRTRAAPSLLRVARSPRCPRRSTTTSR